MRIRILRKDLSEKGLEPKVSLRKGAHQVEDISFGQLEGDDDGELFWAGHRTGRCVGYWRAFVSTQRLAICA